MKDVINAAADILDKIQTASKKDELLKAALAYMLDVAIGLCDDTTAQESQNKPLANETAQTDGNAKAEKNKKEPKSRGRNPFDVGKMNALLQAGWTIPKIADEMGVSAPTIRKYMRQEGYKC